MDQRYVGHATYICVKHGNKFSAEHVNRLYRMVGNNTSSPFTFVCLTENSDNIDPGITIMPIDESLGLEKWWWKICLFKLDIPGIKIFLDLDVVIQSDISYLNKKSTTISIIDFSFDSSMINDVHLNSSVMVWDKDFSHIYDKFICDKQMYLAIYRGLDGFMCHELPNDMFEPLPPFATYSRLYGDPHDDTLECNDRAEGFGTHFRPEYSICIFNNAHDPKFYQKHRKYFL